MMQLANDGDLSIKYGDFTSKHWDLTIHQGNRGFIQETLDFGLSISNQYI
jgi:hypothetical protein